MFFKTIDFSKFSSIKVGNKIEVLMIEKGDSIPQNRLIIGHANNLLVSPTPPELMMLSKDFDFIKLNKDILTIGCATPTGKVVSFVRKHDIAGFEFFSKLPGSVGGMIAMNAGVKSYEIFNILESIKINDEWIDKEKIEHGYRFAKLSGVVSEARFKITYGFSQELLDSLVALRANQPKEPSAGSAFKNPSNDYAGRIIEAIGLKGVRKGGMGWSEVHANFLVNFGEGNFEDALYLITEAKKRAKEQFGIELQEEIQVL
ncbi:MAG: UDP-N-acetylenolpyruvoylglucosamine reductase [Sulfurovum sp. AS07-7]|nr:MAG: UDP-N-acetylenolpyruvoylglucosamine reductase [Sulfurovum sp. AS07-7]